MRYEPLPIELEFEGLDGDADKQEQLLRGYWEDLRNCRGFQLLVKILRDLEADALNALALNAKEQVVLFNTAKFQIVQYIRKCLRPPSPPDADDWKDTVEEDW